MQPLEPGEPRTIGAYRLLGRLGAGGMGRVYLGRSEGGRTVAVKIVHPHFASDDEFRERFRREVAAARRVGGEWTAPVLDADPEAPVPWVATGYVAGPSLDRAVASHGPLPGAAVRAVGLGLAQALVAVHGLGLVHRDVKPSNVLLTLDGPRLIDFGIARATDGTASLTSTGVSIGSPGYMSPEQILGKGVTGAADVFSLGAVMVFAATGRPPFSGDNSATLLYKVVHEEPDLSGLPAGGLRELAAACLAKAPGDRPAPAAVAAALEDALAVPGWLPAPLVEEASRAAVRLLDLDASDGSDVSGADEGGAGAAWGPGAAAPAPAYGGSGGQSGGPGAFGPAGPASGPVPFTAASHGGPGGLAAAGAVPAPGPTPTPGYGYPGAATPTYGGPAGAGGPGGSGAGVGFGTPDPSYGGPAVGPYGSPTQTSAGAGGGTAGGPYGTAADGAGGEGRRVTLRAAGRRFSCTVVVAAAAVLAALAGGLYSMELLPGTGGDRRDTASDSHGGTPAATPPKGGTDQSRPDPSTSPTGGQSSSPSPGATAGTRTDVPQALVGTWKGTVTTSRLGVPSVFEITIRKGKVGEVVGRDKSVLDVIGTDCSGDWKLASATDTSLVLDTAGGPNPAPGICSNGSADERFTLNPNGTLHYKSGDAAAGNPEGDLIRVL
ncbi:serine/threonine-protein kinase [Streptomyces sp. NPDC048603]|uniref:serine/threonine-protein kinase n=1 Tax=Streptomyces sp. NPDC048603 TaxID=3365577 RepID=UPI00371E642D